MQDHDKNSASEGFATFLLGIGILLMMGTMFVVGASLMIPVIPANEKEMSQIKQYKQKYPNVSIDEFFEDDGIISIQEARIIIHRFQKEENRQSSLSLKQN